jgi:hypothetical protein
VALVLRRTCTPAFAAELLSAPPRPVAARPARRARTQATDVVFIGADGLRAFITGTARRGRVGEPFSFVFERHSTRWLASGVGE